VTVRYIATKQDKEQQMDAAEPWTTSKVGLLLSIHPLEGDVLQDLVHGFHAMGIIYTFTFTFLI